MTASLAWAIDGLARSSNEDNHLYITRHSGAVDLRTAGVTREVGVGATVELPARIVTGADGSLGLRQQQTSISIAADSDVEIPEAARDGQLIARLVQHRGNVFYDVETRPVDKLRVETPYLVAVVKGTQFNVSVDGEHTMISLFEGQLELRMPDDGASIELNAGEIAIRSRVDAAIRVLSMDAVVPQGQAAADRDDSIAGVPGRLDGVVAGDGGALGGLVGTQPTRTALDAVTSTEVVDGGLTARIDLGNTEGADLGLATEVDLGAGSVDLGVDTGVDLGAGSVDLGLDTGVDLGAGSVDLGVDAGVDLGAGSVDLGLDAGVDLGAGGVDLGLDAGVDTGGIDLGVDLGIDLTTEPPLIDPDGGLLDGGLLDLTPEPEEPGGGLLPLRIL